MLSKSHCTFCGILWSILLFPIGLLCLCCCTKDRCSNCSYTQNWCNWPASESAIVHYSKENNASSFCFVLNRWNCCQTKKNEFTWNGIAKLPLNVFITKKICLFNTRLKRCIPFLFLSTLYLLCWFITDVFRFYVIPKISIVPIVLFRLKGLQIPNRNQRQKPTHVIQNKLTWLFRERRRSREYSNLHGMFIKLVVGYPFF